MEGYESRTNKMQYGNIGEQDTNEPTEKYTSVDDAFDYLYKGNSQLKNKEEKRAKKKAEVQAEKDFLQNYIYDNANDKPHIVICYVLLTVLSLFIFYYIFIRCNVQGKWYTEVGNLYYIKQNMITNNVVLCAGVNDEVDGSAGVNDEVDGSAGVNDEVNGGGASGNARIPHSYRGKLSGNLLHINLPVEKLNDKGPTIGIWDGKNKIILLNNIVLYRVVN